MAEARFNATTELNENIIKTGQLIAGLIDVAAKSQSTLTGFHNSLISKNKQGIFLSSSPHATPYLSLIPLHLLIFISALIATDEHVRLIEGQVKESRGVLGKLMYDIKAAWGDWASDQRVKLSFQIADAVSTNKKKKKKKHKQFL